MTTVKPTLLILAAGLGSRYGGSKQIDTVGPQGACLFDYSIHDARKAGFGKIVFLISRAMAADFQGAISVKYGAAAHIHYAYQELDDLPAGCTPPAGRSKPWGTGHGILAAREVIGEPFAVINADDYYGPDSFQIMADTLMAADRKPLEMVMVGFRLDRTLSPHGFVSRGVCLTENGFLQSVVEREQVQRLESGICYIDAQGRQVPMAGDSVVSMNFWGFTPETIFPILHERFEAFLDRHLHNSKAEFYIPFAVDEAIAQGQIKVRVARSPEDWFGMTYAQDRREVMAQLSRRTQAGDYPENLFSV
jgi:UTP-glucose-1-phosphate uridylyltransferase